MKTFKKLNKIVCAITIIAYLSSYISPEVFWVAAFFALAIPVLIIFNILFLLYWLIKKRKMAYYSAFVLLAGYNFIFSTFSFHMPSSEKKGFSVLSYNVRVFNVYGHLNKDFKESKKIIDWVLNDNSDVMCFQEYYNRDDSELFNITQKFKNEKKYFAYSNKNVLNSLGAEFGLVIFSKWPIIKTGRIDFFPNTSNSAIYADIKVNNDTLRIFNVHFQSINLDPKALTELKKFKNNFKYLYKRLKANFIIRAKQVEVVEKYITQSPYKVILCGDLNDTPYSYTYSRLKKHANNAFEKAGTGFGFTLNNQLFFLRIDNLFYSEGLNILTYNTLRDVKYSDHYPIKTIFKLP